MAHPDVLIVGGGIFGVMTALELRGRGASVLLVDPGPLPHPDASSTDISKLVRADYGSDLFYTELMEDSLARFRAIDRTLPEPLFHEDGILILSEKEMAPGSFEYESFATLSKLGYPLERLDESSIRRRFPAWKPGAYSDGYWNPRGGFVESGKFVAAMLDRAIRAGVKVRQGVRIRPLEGEGAVRQVSTDAGESLHFDRIVIAAGSHTPILVPELADRLTPVGQPIFHFDQREFSAENPRASAYFARDFPPWAADIARSGWYGFPLLGGVVKIANHGPGTVVDPRAPRIVSERQHEFARSFVQSKLPGLAQSTIVATRLCLYCDAFDGDFFIDRHPHRDGLIVAAGGSGHAFKFAPLLGELIANVVTGSSPPKDRFRWRERSQRRLESARFGGDIS